MTTILAVINAGPKATLGVLASEALRKAASAAGLSLHVELSGGGAVSTPFSGAALASATGVILVGADAGDASRFAGLPVVTVRVDDVLADAAAVLARLPAPVPAAVTAPAALRLVAITSCPTGIAHTFMAAEGITAAAQALGHAVKVETQGSVGAQNTLTAQEIAAADLVIIAADTQVDLTRFQGKRVYQTGTKPAINDGKALIAKAAAEASVLSGQADGTTQHVALTDSVAAAKADLNAQRSGPYKHLMTGVSFMLPFVVTGGLLIAIAFALGGIYAFDEQYKGTLAYTLFTIGAKGGFALMVPALAGYIAYSIANRPGIAPGMIGGMIAANIGAGFLGGIAAGFIAGYGVEFLNRHIRLHRNLEGLKPVLILPILGSLLTGLLMVYVIGTPVASLLAALTEWLKNMQGSSAVLLGVLLGAMMAFDMGGPVNKAAYAFSTSLVGTGVYMPMAAAMAAGMTPPLGIALATLLFKDRFTTDEREAGKAAAVLGISFITEGAIPFAAKDPLRVIPALIAGSALAGAISMAFAVELKVPHGGIFVLPIPNAVTHLGGYVLALVAGTVVTAVLLRLLKKKAA
ncbi:fructose-specific PTS transporter subunit EIIC [Novispirillum itersonii]|uniref:protein-N(pi)-phosphohistidine--D-fructose phosphotransferase n=1 Tax=Novispirillum itersonii TaxID=189 RepID=A0A7X0DKX5_NOVIT|nr:fructose-specific PTS transporter subunit EIIC [Novispirillum itersonii]MBB6209385.1 PTS system fructose-specific IIC component [Novispirillum itersonii]